MAGDEEMGVGGAPLLDGSVRTHACDLLITSIVLSSLLNARWPLSWTLDDLSAASLKLPFLLFWALGDLSAAFTGGNAAEGSMGVEVDAWARREMMTWSAEKWDKLASGVLLYKSIGYRILPLHKCAYFFFWSHGVLKEHLYLNRIYYTSIISFEGE